MIEAKPVVDNVFWILCNDNQKIGSVEKSNDEFAVKINGITKTYRSLPALQEQTDIKFCKILRTNNTSSTLVHGIDAGCQVYNVTWDIQHQLPLFTKSAKSKSWQAAGWYLVKPSRHWKVLRNPKLILLLRYPYHGPYKTKPNLDAQ